MITGTAGSNFLSSRQTSKPAPVRLDHLVAVLLARLSDLTAGGGVRLDDENPAGRLRHSHTLILT